MTLRSRVAAMLGAIALAGGGIGVGFWWVQPGPVPPKPARVVAYYQDPTGKPDFSPTPKQDAAGRDYLPVYDDPPVAASAAAPKPLYYRNPMGLADTSPVPKNDSMGMAYIPVYADAAGDDAGTVTISPGKIQSLGVRIETVATRSVARSLRAVGTVQFDERGLVVVAPKFEGWIETLPVNTTGQSVHQGDTLLQAYGPDLVLAQQDYLIARAGDAALREAALDRLRNWGIAPADIASLIRTGKVSRTLSLLAPQNGVVTDKPAVLGMRFQPGEILFRIADMSRMWLIAEVFEQDIAAVQIGATALVTIAAFPDRRFTGTVGFIYPGVSRETRTARVRIELANPDSALRADMYGQVEIRPATDATPVVAVPDAAIIDGGRTQTVLVAAGAGRFQPRAVRLGRHGNGYVEILGGVRVGEQVVVGANFLIDAESNLRAAFQTFAQGKDRTP